MQTSLRRALIVCALGYFMDVFDYNVFTVLRVSSLAELGIPADAQASVASSIINAQLFGILLGAFLWGYLGDRFGRLKPLYGSIFIYSAATIGCGFVHDPVMYGVCRFFAGLGIAGEVGAATTLIAELMPVARRGWGLAIIAGIGCSGPAAAVVISWLFGWRAIYIGAGLTGLVLLLLRMRLAEPLLFLKRAGQKNHQGSLRILLRRQPLILFMSCVFISSIGTYANWFLNFYSLELSHSVLAEGEVFNQKYCLLYFYTGFGLGHGIICVISQLWHSRLKTLFVFMLAGLSTSAYYLLLGPSIKMTSLSLYLIYSLLGFASGLWGLIIATGAEHFGTNIRATTATLISNLSRTTTIPVLFAFQGLMTFMPNTSAAALIGAVIYALGFWGLSRLHETHELDLDYVQM